MDEERQGERRVAFENKMKHLEDNLHKMGSLVEDAIAHAIESLRTQDETQARGVVLGDERIDALQREIEEKCLEVIATQQPMAKDLRRIATLFKITNDLERMGDYATSIADITLRIGRQPLIKPLVDIPRMSRLTQKMVKRALDAYVREDTVLAAELGPDDDEVDQLFGQVFRELLTIMMENPRTITQATHLLFVARWLERMSDHSTNIAEEVIFLATGDRRRLNP